MPPIQRLARKLLHCRSFGEHRLDSGRRREDFELCLAVCCAVDRDVSIARRAAAATIAFYATVNTYEPLFAPFAREVANIREALMSGDQYRMVDAVSDEMVDTFAVAGPPGEVKRKVGEYAQLADSICLSPPDQLIEPRETEHYREALLATFSD